MNQELEDDLRSALGHASERAPLAPGGLSAHIVSRSRRRRMRTHALLAAATVVVIAGGAGLALRGTDGDAQPVAVNPTWSAPAMPDPVEKVWPEAVWKIPAKLPGVGKYQPRRFIDDHTVLLETWESFEKANAVYAYDLGTGQVRKIADIRTPKGVYASGFTVGGGRIVWQTIADMATRFWSVPISGGTPEPIATDRTVKGRGDGLAVVGDRLAFSLLEGGVFTVPLGGGTVTAVEGAAGHHILRWPWVGTPGDYTPDNEPSFETLLNAETGQTSKALVRPGEEYVRCGVKTCVGIRPDETNFYRLRDGSQERDLPASAVLGLAADRFIAFYPDRRETGQVLYDLATGTSGDLGLRPASKKQSIYVEPGLGDGRLVAYQLKNEYVIIDLTKIPG